MALVDLRGTGVGRATRWADIIRIPQPLNLFGTNHAGYTLHQSAKAAVQAPSGEWFALNRVYGETLHVFVAQENRMAEPAFDLGTSAHSPAACVLPDGTVWLFFISTAVPGSVRLMAHRYAYVGSTFPFWSLAESQVLYTGTDGGMTVNCAYDSSTDSIHLLFSWADTGNPTYTLWWIYYSQGLWSAPSNLVFAGTFAGAIDGTVVLPRPMYSDVLLIWGNGPTGSGTEYMRMAVVEPVGDGTWRNKFASPTTLRSDFTYITYQGFHGVVTADGTAHVHGMMLNRFNNKWSWVVRIGTPGDPYAVTTDAGMFWPPADEVIAAGIEGSEVVHYYFPQFGRTPEECPVLRAAWDGAAWAITEFTRLPGYPATYPGLGRITTTPVMLFSGGNAYSPLYHQEWWVTFNVNPTSITTSGAHAWANLTVVSNSSTRGAQPIIFV